MRQTPASSLPPDSRARRGNALLIAALGAIACTPLAAQPIDIDASFSGDGIATILVDNAMSTERDRGIAVFPIGAGEHLMVIEAASPTADRVRIALAVVNGNGSHQAPVVDSKNFDLVDAACQQPDGKVIVAASDDNANGSAIEFRRFLVTGALDTTFNGSGATSYGSNRDERVNAMLCGQTQALAVIGSMPNDGGPRGTRLMGIEYATGAQLPRGLFPAAASQDEGKAAVELPSGQVVIAYTLVDDTTPLGMRFRVYPSIAVSAAPVITDHALPVASCGLGSSILLSAVHRMAVDATGRIVVAGSIFGSFNSRIWTIDATVGADRTVSSFGCGSLQPDGTGAAIWPTGIVAHGDAVYINGTMYVGVTAHRRQYLARFRRGSGGYAPDTGMVAGGLLPMPMPHSSLHPGPFTDEGGTMYLDQRPATPRLLVSGTADWNDPDTDASLTRFILAPMFGNGFE
jgi:hypothetical protein